MCPGRWVAPLYWHGACVVAVPRRGPAEPMQILRVRRQLRKLCTPAEIARSVPMEKRDMKVERALGSGIAGTAIVSLLVAMARAQGMDMSFELMLGTFAGLEPGELALTLGLALQLLAGSVLSLGYAWFFERVLHHGGIAAGLVLAVPHAVAAGLLLGLAPALHPLIPERLPEPGLFWANLGAAGVIAVFVLHLVFGAIVGAGYGHVKAERPWMRSARV